jgi:hypothetical protein
MFRHKKSDSNLSRHEHFKTIAKTQLRTLMLRTKSNKKSAEAPFKINHICPSLSKDPFFFV